MLSLSCLSQALDAGQYAVCCRLWATQGRTLENVFSHGGIVNEGAAGKASPYCPKGEPWEVKAKNLQRAPRVRFLWAMLRLYPRRREPCGWKARFAQRTTTRVCPLMACDQAKQNALIGALCLAFPYTGKAREGLDGGLLGGLLGGHFVCEPNRCVNVLSFGQGERFTLSVDWTL
jgi:hypothetical protein